VTVIETGSFREAARRLGVRQPSLSQQIGRLEDTLGVELFDRRADGVDLTTAGLALRDRAYEILSLFDETRRTLRDNERTTQGSINVAAIPTLVPFLLPGPLRAFRDAYPQVNVYLSEAPTVDVVGLVARGLVDIGLIASHVNDDRCRFEHVYDEPLVVVMASDSPWAQRDRVCKDDFNEAGVVILSELHCLGDQTIEFCEIQNLDKITQIDSGQIATVLELVRRNLGLSLVPRSSLGSFNLAGVTAREVSSGTPTRPVSLVWKAGRPKSELAACLAKLSCEHLRNGDDMR